MGRFETNVNERKIVGNFVQDTKNGKYSSSEAWKPRP